MLRALVQWHFSWSVHCVTFQEEPSQNSLGKIRGFPLLLPEVTLWLLSVTQWYTSFPHQI